MLAIFLIVFIDIVGFGIIIPLLPFYAEHFGATPSEVGFLMATYSLAQLVTAPLWGRLSDRIGRKPVLVISLAGLAAAYVGIAFAGSLLALFVARSLAGAMAGNIAAAFAYAADITTPENRARGMGLVGAAFSLGFIFGPAIGGILAGTDPANADFTTPALAAAGLSAAALVVTVLFLKPPPSPKARSVADGAVLPASFRGMLADPAVRWVLMLIFLATFVFAGMESVFAIWSRREFGWGPEQNGYVFAFVGLMSALVQGGLIGRLSRIYGERRLIIAGAALLAAGIIALPLAPTIAGLVIALLAVSVGFGMLSPALTSHLSHQAAPGSQGALMGLGRSVSTLARVLGPSAAGVVFHLMGKDWPFYVGGLVLIVVVALAIAGARPRNPAAVPTDTSVADPLAEVAELGSSSTDAPPRSRP